MHIFISPHFDDVVGSCGGMIASLVEQNIPCCITTVFAGPYTHLTEFALHLHQIWKVENAVKDRSCENDRACAVLGASCDNWEFIEAIYRENNGVPIYPYDGDIFYGVNKYDNILSDAIANKVIACSSINDTIYFPGARGKHVDHILAMQAGIILKEKGYNINFYHDFSYTGDIMNVEKYKKYIFRFNIDHFLKKLEAMQRYESQIEMLFGSINDMKNYYFKENQKDGQYFEFYYS